MGRGPSRVPSPGHLPGFGRFAYTVILPSMKSDLGFSHTQMGLLQTGIVTGYLLFAYLEGSWLADGPLSG